MLVPSLIVLLAFPVIRQVHASAQNKTYHNPILPGFHPDPSCILVKEWDDTFFCATSSFNVAPGIPVFASKDLQNFRQIGNVITRESQLPGLATTNGSTGGIWAPTIRYHNNTFIVVSTLVYDNKTADDTSRWDNIIFQTIDPYDSSLWSDPVHFEFEGYDTSPYWDTNGTSYIVGGHAWKIEKMIKGFELNFATGEIIGNVSDLWPGEGGIAPEAPHLFLRDDGYYLMIAEGGTGLGHEVNMARAPAIWGPYEGAPNNPLLTAANTTAHFQTVGHADLFQDTRGNWWTVALSTRSGPEYVYYPMGRETILTPAAWPEGEYPIFDAVNGTERGPLPSVNKNIDSDGYWVGEASEKLSFPKGAALPHHLVHQRFPDPSAYLTGQTILGHHNALALVPSVLNLTGPDGRTAPTPQTFVGRRQEHIEFTFSINLAFNATEDGAEAGITLFLNQGQHFDLGVVSLSAESAQAAGYAGSISDSAEHARYVRLRTITVNSTNSGAIDPLSSPAILALPDEHAASPLKLQVEAVNYTTYEFRYAASDSDSWTTVGWGNSSQVSGGFVGTIAGVFATGNGANVSTPAYIWDWSYEGNPSVV